MRKDTIWQIRYGTYIETSPMGGYDVLINGTNRYLNFGVVSGNSGYGFRDNSGTMEFKNNLGIRDSILGSSSASSMYVPYTGATTDVNLGEYGLTSGRFVFDQTPTGASGVGVMKRNDTDGTVDIGLKGGNVTLQVGQEEILRVVNKTGSTLQESAYQAVRVRNVAEGGAQGQRLAVVLAQGDSNTDSLTTLGIVTETIVDNQEGFITTSGEVRGIDTTGSLQGETWVDGDLLYLSATVAGQLTNIQPSGPDHSVVMGYVVYSHAVHGKIFVKVDSGYELDDLHNVAISSPTNNQVLTFESASNLWKNKSPLSGIIVNSTTITSGTNKAIQYNNNGVYAETLFRYDNVNARLGLGIATPLYSLDFAYSGAWTNSTGAIRIADNQTGVLPGNNIVALNIEFGQTSGGGGIGGGTKTGLRIAQSGTWSHNIGTQVLGLDIPAYSGSVYANYKAGAYIGDKVIIGNRALQNNDHLLQILATGPSSAFTSQATIGFDGSASNGIRSGLTVFQTNTGNIGGGIHFIRTRNNLGYDIEFSNIEGGGYVQGVKMRMFATTGSLTVGSATDFATRFAIVSATQPQLATYFNASNYMRVTTGSTGITTFDAFGASARFIFADSIYLRAGTATVGTAPLYMTSGPLLTAPVVGANEFLTDDYYYTITTGTARKRVVLEDTVLVAGRVPFATTNGRLTDDADMIFAGDTLTVTKFKSSLVESTGVVRLKGYTVATLPVGVVGDTAYVTDATAPTYMGVVVGGGALTVKVFYDGTNWIT